MGCNTSAKKICTLIGSCLLLAPCGLQWYWGNLATYAYSYLYFHSSNISGSQSSWIISSFLIGRTLALFSSGYMLQRLGLHFTVVLGVVIFNSAVFLSYLTVQYFLTFFIVTFGALHGVGTGILYGPCLEASLEWKDQGFITSIIQSSYNLGAVILNEFITLIVNPYNLLPNEGRGDFVIFTQKVVVDRVPYAFLYIGAGMFSLQLIGMFMIWKNHSKSLERVAITGNVSSLRTRRQNSFDKEELPSNGTVSEASDLSPRQILRTRAFYILWLSHFLGYYPFLVITSQYKAYGQLFIRDDHFLSYIGTVSVFCGIFSKFVTGILLDRFGYKISLIALYTFMAVPSCFFPVAPGLDRWFYLILVLLLGCSNGTILVTHIVTVVKLFGPKHITSNTGLVSTAMIAVMLSSPPFIAFLLEISDWSRIFYSIFVTSALNVLLVMFFL